MTKKEYLEKRNGMIKEAENLIGEGKLEEYQAKEKEIKDLDEKFENIATAMSNLAAVKDAQKVDPAFAAEAGVETGTVFAEITPDEPKNEIDDYRNAWAKTMMGQSLIGNEQNVFDKVNSDYQNSAQTAETHAVVIPESVSSDIWKEAFDLYPLLADLNMTHVKGDITLIKETDSGADAKWYDEETEVEDGDFVLGTLNLTGCELAKAIPISWKLRKMSIERFIPYIVGLLAEKIGSALAKAVFSGAGKPGTSDNFKPEPKGVLAALEAENGTPQIVEFGKLGYTDLTSAMAKIKSAYKKGAAIYASNTVIWDVLANILDGNKRPIFIPDVTLGGVGRMFGLPVKEDDSVGEHVLVGNINKGYAANVNEEMTIYMEDHVKKRITDYMSYAIVDGDVLTTKAFAVLKHNPDLIEEEQEDPEEA